MIDASQLRPGNTVERNGELFEVLSYDHSLRGRGSAIVRTKLKNLRSGAVTAETFRPEERFSVARIEREEAQYLYRDADSFVFMNTATYEQVPVSADMLGDASRWLKEANTAFLLTFQGGIIGVELPITVELEVTDTEPAFKGDTAAGGAKPATVETGAIVDVPRFVSVGDRIQVDTRSGKYITRVS